MRQLTVAQLLEDNQDTFGLTALTDGLEAVIEIAGDQVEGPDLIGYLNVVHPRRIHVFGQAEVHWGETQPADKIRHFLAEILSASPPAIIVADDAPVSEALLLACRTRRVALLATPAPAVVVIDALRAYLTRALAPSQSMHGVAMDVLGMGVLITGDSGVGKSELALELISRGHGLVADDVVEVVRYAANSIEGHAPAMLRDFLEVRGLGVLNIRTIFGESSCRRRIRIRLWVHLYRPTASLAEMPRLPLDEQTQEILSVPIRKVVIPVAAGRNLAVLVETAVRSTILLLRGIDTTAEFVERQQRLIDESH